MAMRQGGCLCGGVRYSIAGEMTPALACHCSQCARTSGNFAAMTSCRHEDLVLTADDTLGWFASSPGTERGFCTRCGGNLFWKRAGDAEVFVTAGTLDRPTGVRLAEHIFVASKSDYYEITDGLPQKPEW